MRDAIKPVADRVGTYVRGVIVTLEKDFGAKKGLPELAKGPEKEISTPGALTVSTTTTPATTGSQVQSGSTATSGITKASIIYWTNQARKENGNLPPLTENTLLDTTALAKTNDLFAKQYFEHTSPTGMTVGTQADSAGYQYIMIGENLALGNFDSGKAIVDAWMNSPGHRANILGDRYSEIGVGIRQGTYNGRTVWIATQHFGLPRNACPAVDESLKILISANETHLTDLKAQIDAKKEQIDNTSELSPNYNTRVEEYNALVREYNELVTNTKSEIATYNAQVDAYNICLQN